MREEYRLFVGEDQQFYFNLEAGNNKVILRSSEGYTTKAAALNGIESVRENSQIAEHFQRFIAENNEPQFRLVAENGKIIGVGESYSSEQMMEKGIKSVMKNGPTAPLNDTTNDNQGHGNDYVFIKVKGEDVRIHRGSQTVSHIKELGGVPSGHTLVQITADGIKPLPDDGRVTIKGGEEFDCTPKNGSNS